MWPLPGVPLPDEMAAWVAVWATPQAVVWERCGWTRTVARYCRIAVRAEQPDAQAALLAQALVLESQLGPTPRAMRMMLWTIVDGDDVPERPRPPRSSARERMKAL